MHAYYCIMHIGTCPIQDYMHYSARTYLRITDTGTWQCVLYAYLGMSDTRLCTTTCLYLYMSDTLLCVICVSFGISETQLCAYNSARKTCLFTHIICIDEYEQCLHIYICLFHNYMRTTCIIAYMPMTDTLLWALHAYLSMSDIHYTSMRSAQCMHEQYFIRNTCTTVRVYCSYSCLIHDYLQYMYDCASIL